MVGNGVSSLQEQTSKNYDVFAVYLLACKASLTLLCISCHHAQLGRPGKESEKIKRSKVKSAQETSLFYQHRGSVARTNLHVRNKIHNAIPYQRWTKTPSCEHEEHANTKICARV